MNRLLIVLMVFLSSCAAKKEAARFEMQPDWVKQKPIISGYYVGVGSAKKIGTAYQYKQNARKDALADLASEVSTKVNSTSVLHSIETDYGIVENYNQRIEISTSEYLEGFEPIDFYEDEGSYWIYFKVDKAEFHKMKKQKKQAALSVAALKYKAGLKELEENDPRESLTFFLQGLTAISAYLSEDTKTEYEGSSIDIGNELYSSIDQVITGLSIGAKQTSITIKRGGSFSNDLFFFVNFNDKPVYGIPVNFSFTGGYLKKDEDVSDFDGRVELQIGKVNSGNGSEQISATMDLKDIARKAVGDLFIRGLISKRKTEPAIVTVYIEPSTLSIQLDENTCALSDCSKVKSLFDKNAINEGFVLKDMDQADYVFEVNLNYKPGASAGGLSSVFLHGKILVRDQANKTYWVKELNNIKGVGKNEKEAKTKAFDSFLVSFDKIYFQQGVGSIK